MKRLNSVKNRRYVKSVRVNDDEIRRVELGLKKVKLAKESLDLSKQCHPKWIVNAANGDIVPLKGEKDEY